MAINHASFSTTGGARVVTVAEVLQEPPVLNTYVEGGTPGRLAVYFHEADGFCTLYIMNKAGNRWLRLSSRE